MRKQHAVQQVTRSLNDPQPGLSLQDIGPCCFEAGDVQYRMVHTCR